jgi:hypothetical protein
MNSRLAALAGNAAISDQLNSYFGTVDEWHDGIDNLGLLPTMAAIEQTESFREFHPLVRHLQGIILDDPDTSDHHVVLCRDPLGGVILHLAHDGDSRIVFGSIDSFLAAARRASDARDFLQEEHPEHAWVVDDQAALKSLIVLLRSEPDGEDVVPALVQSLDLSDADYLSTLVDGDDVYVAEAVCHAIAKRPAPHLISVTARCEQHPHAMVRNAAALAARRIADL